MGFSTWPVVQKLTQTGCPSQPLPQKGCCRRTLAPVDQAETGRKPSPHCKPASCSIVATMLRPHGLGRVLGLTPPLRWTGQQGTEQSPPTICPQPQQPKPPSGLCHPELRVGPLFRPPCCCQRHPCSCSSARSCNAISSDSQHECRVDGQLCTTKTDGLA